MMNNFLLHFLFIILSVLLYLPARRMKYAFSGRNYSEKKFWLATLYSLLLACLYLDYFKSGTIPFYGPLDRTVLGWVSIFMFLLHAFTLPREWKVRRGYLTRRFNLKIRKHEQAFDEYRMAHHRKSYWFFWK